MTETAKHPDREDIMAWVDGELPVEAGAFMQSHLSTCPKCQALVGDLRAVHGGLLSWAVESAPRSLQIPTTEVVRWWRRWPVWAWLPVPVAAVALAIGVVRLRPADLLRPTSNDRAITATATTESAKSTHALRAKAVQADAVSTPSETPQGQAAAPPLIGRDLAQPLVAKLATIRMVVASVDDARRALERYLKESGGAIRAMNVTGDPPAARTLTAVVAVAPASLDASLQAMRALGRVQNEAQSSEDVSAEAIDLDARLANARVTEARLQAMLANRTAKLSDVLAVEREAAEVRETIERMDAARKHLAARTATASITVTMTEDRRAEIAPTMSPVSRDLSNAFRDGVRGAAQFLLRVVTLTLRIAPTAAIAGVLVSPLLIWRRRRRYSVPGGQSR